MTEEDPQGPSPEEVRAERNRQIGEFFRNHTAERTAKEFGLSAASVRKITAELGITKGSRAPKYEDESQKIISEANYKVGFRFYSFMSLKLRTPAQTAEELGWSPQKVSAIGKGHYDLSLDDLVKIAGYMGKTMSELLDKI